MDLFSLPGLGFCYTIVRGPANATVLAGSEARFNCTVSQDWKIIIWLSNGKLVLTVVNPTGPVITDNRFTSQNYTAGNEFTSELIIHVVRQSDSGKIECGSQGGSENGYAFLTVQGVYEFSCQRNHIKLLLKHSLSHIAQIVPIYCFLLSFNVLYLLCLFF